MILLTIIIQAAACAGEQVAQGGNGGVALAEQGLQELLQEAALPLGALPRVGSLGALRPRLPLSPVQILEPVLQLALLPPPACTPSQHHHGAQQPDVELLGGMAARLIAAKGYASDSAHKAQGRASSMRLQQEPDLSEMPAWAGLHLAAGSNEAQRLRSQTCKGQSHQSGILTGVAKMRTHPAIHVYLGFPMLGITLVQGVLRSVQPALEAIDLLLQVVFVACTKAWQTQPCNHLHTAAPLVCG